MPQPARMRNKNDIPKSAGAGVMPLPSAREFMTPHVPLRVNLDGKRQLSKADLSREAP